MGRIGFFETLVRDANSLSFQGPVIWGKVHCWSKKADMRLIF
jgi:hypothetical protein